MQAQMQEAKPVCAALSRSEILSSYGQTEASLTELTGIIAAADARRLASRGRTNANQQDEDSDPDQQHEQTTHHPVADQQQQG